MKTILFVFIVCFSLAAVCAANTTYVVKEGDTLGSIANQIYKDSNKWRELWNLNPQITNPDLIYPGQQLSIDQNKIKPIAVYTQKEVYDKIVRYMFKVNRVEYTSRESIEQQLEAYKEYLTKAGTKELHEQRGLLSKIHEFSRKLEFYQLMDGITLACQYDKDYRMTALLAAVAWQETHFNNVPGKNGEITPFQFLPSTVKTMGEHDNVSLEVEKRHLLNSPNLAAARAYEWLQRNGCDKGNTKNALRWWNHGENYPEQVIWKYNKVMWLIKG